MQTPMLLNYTPPTSCTIHLAIAASVALMRGHGVTARQAVHMVMTGATDLCTADGGAVADVLDTEGLVTAVREAVGLL